MHKSLWLTAALLWTAAIAVLCLVRFGELPDVGLESADKYVHVALHFVFVVLWYGYYESVKKWPEARILGCAMAFSIIYGGLIELAQQWFTATRQADLKDVMANFGGAALAALLLLAFSRIRKKRAGE